MAADRGALAIVFGILVLLFGIFSFVDGAAGVASRVYFGICTPCCWKSGPHGTVYLWHTKAGHKQLLCESRAIDKLIDPLLCKI